MAKSDYIIVPAILFTLSICVNTWYKNAKEKHLGIFLITIFSIFVAFLISLKMIKYFLPFNEKADLFGYDINKKGTD